MNPLFDSQVKAITKLQSLKVGALFMEPGTGKTRAALELVKHLNSDLILWLTPVRNITNLNSQIDTWANSLIRNKSSVFGLESISMSDKVYLNVLELLKAACNPVLIVDESLKIKNWDAKRTKRIIELGSFVEYKLILNGTPLSRNLLDLWAQMEFLSPKILNMSLTVFKNTFCEYLKITKRLNNGKGFTKEFIVKYHNVDYLYKLIKPYIFEADLTIDAAKQYIDIDFNIDAQLKVEYDILKRKYLDDEMMQYKNNNIFLEITQKLQHLYSLSSEKFEIIDKFLASTDKSKVLIFRKYIDSDIALRKRYPDIKVLSLQSDSFGLNLQAYNTIIIWDKMWDYALIKQMEHRIYRSGQEDTCRFINLNGNVNLEKLIQENLRKKCNLLDYFKTKTIKEGILEL
jgi:SNF2 family DNA or RNA helicase